MRKTGEDNEDRKMAGFFRRELVTFRLTRGKLSLEGLDRHQSLGKKAVKSLG